jgi:hypothetical protein
LARKLDVDANTVLVLRGCGPKGYPGMPEVSNMPLPKKLLEQGVRDMVRICDGRMSGTAYGTVVLHVAPEAAAGGPLALVRTGDEIILDVPGRTLTLEVTEEELQHRRPNAATLAGFANPGRGWERLYIDHVQQADKGADFDYPVVRRGLVLSAPGGALRLRCRDSATDASTCRRCPSRTVEPSINRNIMRPGAGQTDTLRAQTARPWLMA